MLGVKPLGGERRWYLDYEAPGLNTVRAQAHARFIAFGASYDHSRLVDRARASLSPLQNHALHRPQSQHHIRRPLSG